MDYLVEHFARPEALFGLLLAPLWWLVLRILDRRRERSASAWLGPRRTRLAAEAGGTTRRGIQRLLLALGLFAVVCAIARPRFGTPQARTSDQGLDLVLCLDVSQSMLATDVEPDRLRRAQQEIAALATAAAGDRIGLVLFAGTARLRVPLTRDLNSLAMLAAEAGPRSVQLGGTDLGAALQTAMRALASGQQAAAADRSEEAPDGIRDDATDGSESGEVDLSGSAIVLLTDGEDRDGAGFRAARACREQGAAVHCVGFGTPLGSKIPIVRDGQPRFLRDRDGQEVITKLEAASLQRVAEAGGGTYLGVGGASAGGNAGRPLTDLYRARIRPAARATWRARAGTELPARYQIPLAFAVACWLLAMVLDLRGRTLG